MGTIKMKYFQAFILGLILNGLALCVYSANNDPGSSDSIVVKVRQLSDRCWENREKDSRLAIELASEGISLAREYGFKDELAQLNNYSGVIHLHYLHNPESSIPFFNNALNLALQIKDSVQIAYVYNNLGDAFYLTGNIALANEYAEKSLDIFKNIGHKRGMAYAFINLGLNDRAKEDYESSFDCFFRAIRIREQIGDSVGMASAYLEVARTLLQMDNKREAMEYFKRSLKLHEELNNKKYMAFSLQGIGDVHFKRAQYDSSLVNYQKALVLDEERDYPSGVVDCQIGIARVFGKKGRIEEGKKLLGNALMNARNNGLSRKELEVLRAKGEF
ncbi:tetratricopeptide repeat protein [Marinilabilia sp.]